MLSLAAALLILMNEITIAATRMNSNTAHIAANPSSLNLKNIMLQKKLTASCAMYSFFADDESPALCHMMYAEIPISAYSIVHTTGNTAPDGANGGCISSL